MQLASFGQDDICVITDNNMVFTFKRDWTPEKRKEVGNQYGIDSLTISNALSDTKYDFLEFEKSKWVVEYPDANTVKLTKSVANLEGKWNYKKNILMSPEGNVEGLKVGPGYVDHDQVFFGVNRLTQNVIIQYLDGDTKFILPGKNKAQNVYIAGSFNEWDPSNIRLKKTSNGWETTINLEPGKYLYKFIVDGEWIKAPFNELKENDGYDNYNSVIYRYNTEFNLVGYPDAENVVLTGSFNNWNEKQGKMTLVQGEWILPVYLKEGTHNYKFIVDNNWITDPSNANSRPNGMGDYNSVKSIGDPTVFRLKGFQDAKRVVLSGNFNGWNEAELSMIKSEGYWSIDYVLSPGNYEYKFIIDGEWITDPENDLFIYHGDLSNSYISIDPNHQFVLDDFSNAREVLVSGSFSGWSEENNRMIWKNGAWRFPIFLRPGKHVYKFIIDGEWEIDPNNPLYEENQFESGNSILWIEDAKQLSLNN